MSPETAYRGHVELCTQSIVAGWTTAPRLDVYVNAECLGHAVIAGPRSDAEEAGFAGARVFHYRFADPLVLEDRVTLRLADDTVLPIAEPASHRPRLAALLGGLDLARPGLELGALSRPTLSKKRVQVSYVDHATAADLAVLYRPSTQDEADTIVETDFVWQGRTSLRTLVGARRYGWAVASHVAEHVADMVGWLGEIAEVLDEDGRIALALPHAERTFDARRPLTQFEDLAAAHLMKWRRPSAHQVLRHILGVSDYWNIDLRHPDHAKGLHDAMEVAAAAEMGTYVDVHCSVFTPASFEACWTLLRRTGLTTLTLAHMQELGRDEFFVTLSK